MTEEHEKLRDLRTELLLDVEKDFRNTLLIIGLMPLGKQLLMFVNADSFFIHNIESIIVETILFYRFTRQVIRQFAHKLNMQSILNMEFDNIDFWTNFLFLIIPLQIYMFFKLLVMACGNSLYIGKAIMGRAQGVFLGIAIFKLYLAKILSSFQKAPTKVPQNDKSLIQTSPININIQYEDFGPASTQPKDINCSKKTSQSVFYPFSVSIITTKLLIKNTIKSLVSIIIQLIYDLFF